jgi:hypothetical protein
VAQDEPHVSVGGMLVQAYFGREKPIFGANLFWERKSYFWTVRHMWQKSSMQKMKENNMRKMEEKQHGVHADKPSHVRVRVLDKNVMVMSQ